MIKKLPVVLVAIAFAATACGGGSDDKTSKAPANSQTSSGPSPKTNPADQALAESAVLTLADFPSGWEGKKSEDSDEEESDRRVAECAGFDYDTYYGSNTGDAYSKDFENDNEDTISNEVTVQADETAATANFATSGTEKFRECFEDEAKRRIEDNTEGEKDFKIGKATLNELSFDKFGDESIAYRLTIPITTKGTDVDVYGDYVEIRVGRAQTVVIAQATFSPFDTDELAELAKVAADRLAEKLKS